MRQPAPDIVVCDDCPSNPSTATLVPRPVDSIYGSRCFEYVLPDGWKADKKGRHRCPTCVAAAAAAAAVRVP
jgi:hypothetical protein